MRYFRPKAEIEVELANKREPGTIFETVTLRDKLIPA
jgi:hypothetical protein